MLPDQICMNIHNDAYPYDHVMCWWDKGVWAYINMHAHTVFTYGSIQNNIWSSIKMHGHANRHTISADSCQSHGTSPSEGRPPASPQEDHVARERQAVRSTHPETRIWRRSWRALKHSRRPRQSWSRGRRRPSWTSCLRRHTDGVLLGRLHARTGSGFWHRHAGSPVRPVFMNRVCSSFRTGGQEEGTRRTPLLIMLSISFTRAGGHTHGGGGYFLSSVGRRSANRPRSSISYCRTDCLNFILSPATAEYIYICVCVCMTCINSDGIQNCVRHTLLCMTYRKRYDHP